MIQTLRDILFRDNRLSADVLRLDLIHPEISGNKWFKLKYHLTQTLSLQKKGMVSFGGAYSNHLVAMAFACKEQQLSSTAIIRGNDPGINNPSIEQMKQYGMKLIFTDRGLYRDKEKLIQDYLKENPDDYYVPEGGCSEWGILGASEIMQPEYQKYTHVICAVGTGTTMAGIIKGSAPSQQVIGISALKVADKNENELLHFIDTNSSKPGANTSKNNYRLLFDYHFGGYARKNTGLISFMNELYRNENLPTDFVYTGKLLYAAYDLVKKKFFPLGSRILIVHSGGLQGNRSLAAGILDF